MTSAKKKEDLEFPEATLVGRASIHADLRELQETHSLKLADDVKHSGDTISYTIVASKRAREIAWKEALRIRDEIRAKPGSIFGVTCIAGVALTAIMIKFVMPVGLDPVVAYAICALALALAAAFFAMVYDYVCRGGYLSSLSGVLSNPITGFYPWMRERVLFASGNAWGIGGKGLYVPRYPRYDYEPYHNVIPFETITAVEVYDGTGVNERVYPAHLIIRTSQRPSVDYVFADASTADGLSAVELADIIKARIETQKCGTRRQIPQSIDMA